jgi:hypothetical protein
MGSTVPVEVTDDQGPRTGDATDPFGGAARLL